MLKSEKTSVSVLFITLLTFQLALPILSTDIYLPSLRDIGSFFDTDPSQIQFSLTIYFIIFGIVQLFYGPLSDCIGRKPIFILSISIYTAASLLCMFAETIQIFIFGRCLQALGTGGAVTVFATIRDLYDGKQAAKLIAYMSAVVAISPIIGPILGGMIQSALSWQWNFALLAIMGLLLLSLSAWLPETNQKQTMTVSFLKKLGNNYQYVLSSKQYLSNALSSAFAFGALFAYVSGAPYVFLNLMQYSSETFGWIFAIAALGYVFGALLNGKLISRFGLNVMYRFGLFFLISGGIAMVLFCYLYPLNTYAIIAPQILCEFGISVVISSCIANALQPIPQCAGTGMALLGFFRFLAASASSGLIIFNGSTALPLAFTVLGFSLLSYSCCFMEHDRVHYPSCNARKNF